MVSDLVDHAHSLSRGALRVQEALEGLDLRLQVVELPSSTRTAQEAAQSIGCSVRQIAKSILFKTVETGRPLLVIASGTSWIDEGRIAEDVGEKVRKAEASFVRQHTGFSIGGLPPLGHDEQLLTFIDQDLLSYDEIWAAAGTPHAVFKLSGDDLVAATGGQVIGVTRLK